jgi:hypothetical protein
MLARFAIPLTLAAIALTTPPAHARDACFGAAARDPQCAGASASRSVSPSPAKARTLPNSPCTAVPGQKYPPVCSFGVPEATATDTVALVGDSHAGHWRAALAEVAAAKGWHGLSITHTSCPFQMAVRDLRGDRRGSCVGWKWDVFTWFAMHPEVSTVFVAGLTGGSSVVAARGKSAFQTSQQGYLDAWSNFPDTVKRIVVIRDTPKFLHDTDTCIERAVKRHKDPGTACARPRKDALDPDPAIAAAAKMPKNRMQAVDLTRYFCSAAKCFPVVGGALVLRDTTHMTGVFSASLGTFLGRAVDEAFARMTQND